jgi:predicted LPLAT superfamily acyltransferase
LAFAIASLTLTRRALRKRLYLPTPPFYQPSHNTLPTVSGGMEAVDALFLATLNVTAIGMAAVGTFMVGWDVAEVEDLRAAVNRGAGFDVYGGDKEADREMEGWVQEMFAKKKDDALDSGDVENVQVGVKEMMEQGGLIAKLGRLASLAEEREERKKQENIENGPASTQQGRALA